MTMAKVDTEVKNLLELLAKNDGKTKIRNNRATKSISMAPHQSSLSRPKRARRIFGCLQWKKRFKV